jgi:hypothetical protein
MNLLCGAVLLEANSHLTIIDKFAGKVGCCPWKSQHISMFVEWKFKKFHIVQFIYLANIY